jgi:hypothetical protein
VPAGLYCTEYDVVSLLGQGGVDLRQDDTPGSTGLYALTTTSGNYTQPSVAATVAAPVFNGLAFFAGQCVYVQTGGFYLVSALSIGTLTLQNLGTSGNAASSSTIPSGSGVSISPLADFINRACDEIDEHCLQFYTAANLLTSDWVAKQAASIAAYYFCLRRGNPAPVGIAAFHDIAMQKLQRVQQGALNIPNVPKSKATVPVMSNLRPALRPHPHAVVETQRSTGTPASYHQNQDPWDATGINNQFYYDFSI